MGMAIGWLKFANGTFMTLAAVTVLTTQIQSAAACDFTKSAAYSQHSRHAHRTAAVHVANLQR